MSTLAFTAQALGAGETQELRAPLIRVFVVAPLIGACLIVLQMPLASVLMAAIVGSEGVPRATKTYFSLRIWSAPQAIPNYGGLALLVAQCPPQLCTSVQ